MKFSQNLVDISKKKYYFQGFNATPMLVEPPALSLRSIWDELGYGYTVIVIQYEQDKCYFLYSWDDLYKMVDQLLKNVDNKKGYLEWMRKRHDLKINEYLNYENKLKGFDFSQLSTTELVSLLGEAILNYRGLLDIGHVIECFTLTKEETIRGLLDKEITSSKIKNDLIAPCQESFLTRYHNALRMVRTKEEMEQIQRHWFWVHNGYSHTHVLTIKELLEEKKRLPKKEGEIVTNVQKGMVMKKYKVSKELQTLITIHDAMFEIHDKRKEFTTRALHYVDALLRELSKRYSIPHEDIRYLHYDEVTEDFLSMRTTKKVLSERRKYSVYVYGRDVEEKLDGKKGKEYFSLFNREEKKNSTELKGNGASPGKVVGIVKVCRGLNEIVNMKEGMILVACMTQPEFMPAIKKAKAIITDEGGITCHAAIISREMKIPCVIGTKNATRVLKDGDKVEVDATSGVVKILQ